MTTALSDTFTDTTGTNLPSHTMDVGPGWNVRQGTFHIVSNACTTITNADGDNAVCDSGQADAVISFDGTSVYVNTGNDSTADLIFRWQDDNNFWLLQNFSPNNSFFLYERVGGSYNLRSSNSHASSPSGTSHAIKVSAIGTALEAFFDGTSCLTYTSSSYQTKTTHGIRVSFNSVPGGAASWDNFLVTYTSSGLTASVSDSASATDTCSAVLTATATVSDSASATDTTTATMVATASVSDNASATDTCSALMAALAAVVDNASATDTTSGTTATIASVSDSASATDSTSATLVATASVVDSASATDTCSATMVAVVAIVEIASATDSTSAVVASHVTVIEIASATDITNGALSLSATIADMLSATDSTSATIDTTVVLVPYLRVAVYAARDTVIAYAAKHIVEVKL